MKGVKVGSVAAIFLVAFAAAFHFLRAPHGAGCAKIAERWMQRCLVDAEPADTEGFNVDEIARRAHLDREVVARGLFQQGCVFSRKGRPREERHFEVVSNKCDDHWLVCVNAVRGEPLTYAFHCSGEEIVAEYGLVATQSQEALPPSATPEVCAQCQWRAIDK